MTKARLALMSMLLAAVPMCLYVSCRRVPASPIDWFVSSESGERLAPQASLAFTRSPAAGLPAIAVDDSRRYQRLDGFGATFNEAGLLVLNRLEPAHQEEVLRSLFDANQGAGFSLMSAPIAACDFASAGPWYSYDDVAGDVELKHFSIARDLGPSGLITYIKRARRHGRFQLQTTMDYPPDWMLDARMNLKPEYYDTLARYLVKYVQAYESQGVPIDVLSPFNEPFHVYCRITYPQIRELLKNHIAPRFREAGLRCRLQPSDSNNRSVALQEFPAFLNDPALRPLIHSLPVHGYDWIEESSAPLGELHRRYPHLPIWMTEVCHMKESPEGKRPTLLRTANPGSSAESVGEIRRLEGG